MKSVLVSSPSHSSLSRGVSLAALLAGVGLATNAPAQSVSAPFGVDSPKAMSYSSGHTPAAAFDGDGYLSVFDEGGAIRGARLDGAGNPLQIDWLDVRTGDVDAGEVFYYPSVAFGGGKYLAAWAGSELGYRLVGSDGSLEPAQVISADGMYPALGFDGERFVIAWLSISETEGRNTELGFIDLDGSFEHATRLSNSGNASWLELAVGTNTTLVTWQEHPDTSTSQVWAARVDRSGAALDPGGFPIADESGSDTAMHVASSGANYLVAWTASGTSTRAIDARVVPEDGAPGPVFTLSGNADSSDVVVGFDGEQYAAAWIEQAEYPYTLVGRKIAVDGTPTASVALPAHDPRTNDQGQLVWAESEYLVTYSSNDGLVGQLLTADLEGSGSAFPLSFIPAYQGSPQVAFDGQNYVLAWDEQRGLLPLYSARSTRVSQAGQVLSSESVDLSGEAEGYPRVAVASAGAGSALAAWSWGAGPIWTQRLGSDGNNGPLVEMVPNSETGINLASNGSGYLAMYMRKNAAEQYEVVGQLLDDVGTNQGDPFLMLPGGVFYGGSLKRVGDGYFFTYQETDQVIRGVSAQGELSEPVVLSTGQSFVDSAVSPERTLLVWRPTSGAALYGRFVSDSTFSGEDFVIADDVYYGLTAWDGSRFAVVWENEAGQISLSYVETDGSVSDAVPVVDSESHVYGVASNGAGQLLVTASEYQGPYGYSQRIVSRLVGEPVGELIDLDPPPTPTPNPSPTTTPAPIDPPAPAAPGDPEPPANPPSPASTPDAPVVSPEPSDSTADDPATPSADAAAPSSAQGDAGTGPDGTELEGLNDDATGSSGLCSLPAAPRGNATPWLISLLGAYLVFQRRRTRAQA